MLTEKKRLGVAPKLFTADGTVNGEVEVSDARGFFVGQIVFISSTTKPTIQAEIKRFLSPTRFKVGPIGQPLKPYIDISGYLVSEGASISAPEQDRPGITEKDHERAVYAEEPIVAKRVIFVDEFGNYYGENNRIPVSVPDNISVKISHLQTVDNTPADSTRIGDGIQTVTGTATNIGKYLLDVNSVNKLIRREFDDVEVLSKNDDGDPTIVVFRSSGNLIATLNLTYDLDGDFVRAQVTYV